MYTYSSSCWRLSSSAPCCAACGRSTHTHSLSLSLSHTHTHTHTLCVCAVPLAGGLSLPQLASLSPCSEDMSPYPHVASLSPHVCGRCDYPPETVSFFLALSQFTWSTPIWWAWARFRLTWLHCQQIICLTWYHCHHILKLACWVCATNLSALRGKPAMPPKLVLPNRPRVEMASVQDVTGLKRCV